MYESTIMLMYIVGFTDLTTLQRKIEVTDRQIDQLMYELYELTEEEIRVIEENAGK